MKHALRLGILCSEKRWKSTEIPQNVDPKLTGCQKINKDCCKVLDFFNLCIIASKSFIQIIKFMKRILIKNSHLANIPIICEFYLFLPPKKVCFPPLPLADLDWNICDLTETRSKKWGKLGGKTWKGLGVRDNMIIFPKFFEDPIYQIFGSRM